MSKPIEPGCLAVVIGASQNYQHVGKTVTVVEPAVNHRRAYPNSWVVEGIEPCIYAQEKYLIRIDDYDASKDVVAEDREVEKC